MPPGVAKSKRLQIKLSPADLIQCDELAARHGLDRSELVRRAVQAVADHPSILTRRKK